MSDVAASSFETGSRPKLDHKPHKVGAIGFIVVLALGLAYAAFSINHDITSVGEKNIATGAFVLLGIALLIALAFEFVNGFHDTANAVATVIYTHAMPPMVAVVWSGFFNFLGVLTSSGAVAFTVVTLLPVELILQVGSGAGYAMIFALLIAAIIWNLGTWALGLPNSSSHALIGSIIGVGLANQLTAPSGSATSGVDWNQALGVFKALLFSPIVGFVCAYGLLLLMKLVIKNKTLYSAPEGNKAPPGWIRGLLILTCTGVSFAHGSNDGQKGMGLIMLILIGVAPTAYALNRAMPASDTPAFVSTLGDAKAVLASRAGSVPAPTAEVARTTISEALKKREVDVAPVYAAVATMASTIADQVKSYGAIATVPAAVTSNVRNDMYLTADALAADEDGRVRGSGSAEDQGDAGVSGQGHAVHSVLGEGIRGAGAWPWDDGGLETHRGDRGREDRQDAPDLCAGCLGRAGGHGDDRGGGYVWVPGFHHARAVERCGGNDGGQRVGPAVEHGAEHGTGLGDDAAGGDADLGLAVRTVPADILDFVIAVGRDWRFCGAGRGRLRLG